MESYRQSAVRDVTTAYMDVLLAKEIESIASATLAQRERHLTEAKRRYELGVATDYDVLSANVAVENARPEVIRAGSLVRTAYEMSPAHWRRRFPIRRNTRTSSQAMLELAKIGTPLQGIGEAAPRFSRGYGWKGLSAGPLEGRPRNWSAGIFLSFPFFDGYAGRGRVIQAESDRERQRIDAERSKDGITLEARTTVDAVREAAEIVRALSGTVEQARRLLQMAEQGYGLGVKTQIEVQDAELNLRTAEGNLARARRDYRVALVNLDWVRGAL